MSQNYSDLSRAEDPYSLPDIEVWEDQITIINSDCGTFEVGRQSESARGFCPSCDRATCVHDLSLNPEETGISHTEKTGWFYWFCLPGCLPDSEPIGPFVTEQEALSDAQDSGE